MSQSYQPQKLAVVWRLGVVPCFFALYKPYGLAIDFKYMRLSTERIRQLGSSHFNYWFGYVANMALVQWMASGVVHHGRILIGWSTALASVLAGLALWTLLEYVLHRFVYHVIVSSLQVGHRLHHERPKALIGVPWWVSSVAVIAVFKGIQSVAPQPAVCVVCSSIWLGYIGYCILHHASHHWRMPSGYLRRMKRHHLVHHAHPNYNWGFTTPFWDILFDTDHKPQATRDKMNNASDSV